MADMRNGGGPILKAAGPFTYWGAAEGALPREHRPRAGRAERCREHRPRAGCTERYHEHRPRASQKTSYTSIRPHIRTASQELLVQVVAQYL